LTTYTFAKSALFAFFIGDNIIVMIVHILAVTTLKRKVNIIKSMLFLQLTLSDILNFNLKILFLF